MSVEQRLLVKTLLSSLQLDNHRTWTCVTGTLVAGVSSLGDQAVRWGSPDGGRVCTGLFWAIRNRLLVKPSPTLQGAKGVLHICYHTLQGVQETLRRMQVHLLFERPNSTKSIRSRPKASTLHLAELSHPSLLLWKPHAQALPASGVQ